MSRLISQAAPTACRLLSASVFSLGTPFASTTPPSAWLLPESPRAGSRRAPPVTVRGDHKLGAPQLKTQQPAHLERQLAAFAQGFRQNDINEMMRTIAAQLTPDDLHVIAEFYGTGAAVGQVAER
jgi:hypothetical protein